MLKQIKTLAKLELSNLYNLNVFRLTRDKNIRRRFLLLAVSFAILAVMLICYMGGLSYGLILLGLSEVVPVYLITIASVITLFFGIFKAGGVIFRKNGYDTLSALPLTPTAIVISRFLRMYVENLPFAMAVLLPGLAVYGWLLHPGISFYVSGILALLMIPLLPVALSSLAGALITGIASRMKHKSLVSAALSILIILGVLLSSSSLTALEETTITPEMLKDLSAVVLNIFKKLYPPAVWIGNSIVGGDFAQALLCLAFSLGIFAAVIALVSANFHSICRKLYSTSARHNYQMTSLQKNTVLVSLCKREFKRYFSSGIYVTNTIMGPLMGLVFSGAIFFVGADSLTEALQIPFDILPWIPFVLAGIFCLMTTTSVSISMEGKNWWIVKSLPLPTKAILDAKILMNLLLILPFFLISEVLLILALKPALINLLWLLLIPTGLILFSVVYGITINLYFPVLNWDNEAAVVKQSASSLIGGMGGFLLAIMCAVITALIPGSYRNLGNLLLCALLLGLTAWLYRKNNRTDLKMI